MKTLIICILLGCTAISCIPDNSANRPNILFLMSDQHRGDALGVDGNTFVITPNLDKLAGEGMFFLPS